MIAKQDRLIAEQQTYLDMVTASEPYRHVTIYDRINARAELEQLREQNAEQALRMDKMNLDAICERVHAEWMNYNRISGAESRCAIWGEELMKPWNDLSERAKDLDRCTIRAVLDALNYHATQTEQIK